MADQKGLNLFFCLEDDMSSIERFLDLGKKLSFKKGDVVLPPNQKIDHLYYLQKGKVGRVVIAVNGTEKYIKMTCDKSIVGEVIFFKKTINDGYFKAIEDCDIYLFDRDTVNQTLLKDDQIVRDLINWFCNRMKSLNRQVVDGLTKDSYYLVCKFLYEYIESFGKKREDGLYAYVGKLSHYDIAKYIGINRVSVTNIMKRLQEEGIIDKDRQRLIILNMDYLKQYGD